MLEKPDKAERPVMKQRVAKADAAKLTPALQKAAVLLLLEAHPEVVAASGIAVALKA